MENASTMANLAKMNEQRINAERKQRIERYLEEIVMPKIQKKTDIGERDTFISGESMREAGVDTYLTLEAIRNYGYSVNVDHDDGDIYYIAW